MTKATAAADPAGAASAGLTPYVPRVVIEWLREEPEATWRQLEGTLAFVDLSGFTAMSERLAQKGKAGAEELTDVINATFGRLLQVAYENGGGLLKFGGDALLLFFSGAQHAGRAARASYGMRQTLDEIGRPRTSVGVVTLRMHVGLNTGTFPFFLVGGSHRELLLCGPEVSQTVAMEAGAEAGEILLSPATSAALAPRFVGDEKAGGRLLKTDVAVPTAGVAPLPDVEGLPLAECVPVAIRRYLGEREIEAEHRQATVAFLRVAGTDALLDAHGPAGTAEAFDEVVRTVQRAADEHHVSFLETDIDDDGVRIILVAGAPETAGDDEERMLRTVRAVADAKLQLRLHVGVNRGRVFAGEVGASFRRTYTILGDTAALAARLMSKAEAGAVLTTSDVLERSRTPFETVELEPFAVKGKSAPVVAHDVRAVAGGRETSPETTTPFVGRERELAILNASLAPVRMGFGSLVELIGDPGMGKSRLVEELLSQSTDLRAVPVSCEEYELSTAYFPFRGLLRSLLDVPLNGDPRAAAERLRGRIEPVAEDVVPWIPLLALPLDVEIESTPEVDDLQPAFRRARLHGVVETLLAELLPTPTVLVLEDVHWMDEPSSHLLRHLAGQVMTKPWLICATRRLSATPSGFVASEGTPPVAALTIHLEPLTLESARELIDATGANGWREEEIAAIADRSGGNPLFLQELLASGHGEAQAELPESVEAVVTTRIDRLGPADRTLLRYAAVMGSTFSGELVARVLAEDDPSASPDSESWDRLTEFLERDPYTPGAFRFRHALIRDAAYQGLSYRRRRELHASIGRAYESLYADELSEHSEPLSLHFFHAKDHAKTYEYSLAAGERAREKFANVEAAVFYRRALTAAKHLSAVDASARADVWEKLGDVSELAGRYEDAADAYRRARRLARADMQAALLRKEGLVRERSSRYPEALRWFRRALAAMEQSGAGKPSQLALEIRLSYAGVRFRQSEFTDCIDWCNDVVRQALEVDDLQALAHAYYLLHLAYTSIGDPNRIAFRGLALPIYEEVGDLLGQANVLNNLGIDAYYEGRWDQALDLYGRSQALRERIGDVVGAATIANNIGEIKSDQGEYEAARELFTEAREVFARAGSRFLAALAESNLGRLAAREGRFDDAGMQLQQALAEFQDLNARSFVAETRARLAEQAVLAGDAAEALRRAGETLLEVGEDHGAAVVSAMAHRLYGYALMQSGDLEEAAIALEKSARSASSEAGLDDETESFELALTLEAVARLAELRGLEDEGAEDKSHQIFGRLGVVFRPTVPLNPARP
jgi:class 3 adenylate cyclase/tetratricopeptide (TPR) repeat protein